MQVDGSGRGAGGRGGRAADGRGGRGGGRLVGSLSVVYYPGHHGQSFRSKVTAVLPAAASTGRAWSCAEADGGCGRADAGWLLSGGAPLLAPAEPAGVPNYADVRTDAPAYSAANAGGGGHVRSHARRGSHASADLFAAATAAAAAGATGRLGYMRKSAKRVPPSGDHRDGPLPSFLSFLWIQRYEFDDDFHDDWAADDDILGATSTPLMSLGAISGLPSPISDSAVGEIGSVAGGGVHFSSAPQIVLPEAAVSLGGSSHHRGRSRSHSLAEASPLALAEGQVGASIGGWAAAARSQQMRGRGSGLTPSWNAPVMPPVIVLFLFNFPTVILRGSSNFRRRRCPCRRILRGGNGARGSSSL